MDRYAAGVEDAGDALLLALVLEDGFGVGGGRVWWLEMEREGRCAFVSSESCQDAIVLGIGGCSWRSSCRVS